MRPARRLSSASHDAPPMPMSEWLSSVWWATSTPAAAVAAVVRLPRRATRTRVARSSNRPGATGYQWGSSRSPPPLRRVGEGRHRHCPGRTTAAVCTLKALGRATPIAAEGGRRVRSRAGSFGQSLRLSGSRTHSRHLDAARGRRNTTSRLLSGWAARSRSGQLSADVGEPPRPGDSRSLGRDRPATHSPGRGSSLSRLSQ
jgi:hypothetical protein